MSSLIKNEVYMDNMFDNFLGIFTKCYDGYKRKILRRKNKNHVTWVKTGVVVSLEYGDFYIHIRVSKT